MKKENGITRLSLIIAVLVIIGLIFLAVYGVIVAINMGRLSNSGIMEVAKSQKNNNTTNYDYSWHDNYNGEEGYPNKTLQDYVNEIKEEEKLEEVEDYLDKTFGEYILTPSEELSEIGFIYETDNGLEVMFLGEGWATAEIGIKEENFETLVENKAEWKEKLENQGYKNINPEEKTIGGVNYLITPLEDNGVVAIAAYAESPKEGEAFTILVTSVEDLENYRIMEKVSKVILEIRIKENTNSNSLVNKELSELVYDAEYDNDCLVGLLWYYPVVKINGEKVIDESLPELVSIQDRKYPYINIDSEDAQQANKQIEELYEKYEDEFIEASYYMSNHTKEEYISNFEWDYRYIIKEKLHYSAYKNGNILSVVLKEPIQAEVRSSIDEMNFCNYSWNFNLDTLELISYEEAYEKLGYNASTLKDKIQNLVSEKIKNIFEETRNDCVEETMHAYDTEDIKYFIDEKGKLNVIVLTTLPGIMTDGVEFIYTIE